MRDVCKRIYEYITWSARTPCALGVFFVTDLPATVWRCTLGVTPLPRGFFVLRTADTGALNTWNQSHTLTSYVMKITSGRIENCPTACFGKCINFTLL